MARPQEHNDRAISEVLRRYFPGARRPRHAGRARYGRLVSGADLAAEFLCFCGADVIFGIPGGASLPLNDAFTAAHDRGAYRYLLTGHEQGAGFEAEGFAAASGRAGFCTATSGPGATNLVTPLADSLRDSRPLLALTGNTATTAEPEAFQAIDIVGITDGKATKLSLRAEHPSAVQEMLVRAYHAAVTGRPGSALVDLPKDVQAGTTTMRPWEDVLAGFEWEPPRAGDDDIRCLADLLASAERPLLYVGHGLILGDGVPALQDLCRRFSLPVVTTLHARGALPTDNPLHLGMIGMHGPMVANLAAYLADLVVSLGARFDDRVVGARPAAFAPHARLVHVDADARQLNRVRAVDLAVHGDVRDTLERLLLCMQGRPCADRRAWLAELETIGHVMPVQSYDRPKSTALSHEFVYTALAQAIEEMDADVVTTFDVGTHQMKAAQWFPASTPRSRITSGGMGSMGCALPMAVGASFARPGSPVLACCGDGGLVMASHELDTIGAYHLPIKILVFDDSSLGMVNNWHSLYFGGRRLTSDRRRGRRQEPLDLHTLKEGLQTAVASAGDADSLAATLAGAVATLAAAEWPLFAAVAAGYGIPGERVHDKAQCAAALRRALATPGPYMVQVMLPSPSGVYPLMEPGTTPQEMVWREHVPGSGAHVYAHERFDYHQRRLRTIDLPDQAVEKEGPAAIDAGVPAIAAQAGAGHEEAG